ncbi:hypothetical protein JNUCC23_04285 [Peribacillus sp. JNUCC 23]|uniref:hypothetical protein n=1 Tax=Peribacillus sp. NPDC096379 TaxID=3364393 RepID=UPI0038147732
MQDNSPFHLFIVPNKLMLQRFITKVSYAAYDLLWKRNIPFVIQVLELGDANVKHKETASIA